MAILVDRAELGPSEVGQTLDSGRAFRRIQAFNRWAREEAPEEFRVKAAIGPVKVGEITLPDGVSAQVTYGLTQIRHRSMVEEGQPYTYMWGSEKVVGFVQQMGEKRYHTTVAYERDVQELPDSLVEKLVERLDALRTGGLFELVPTSLRRNQPGTIN